MTQKSDEVMEKYYNRPNYINSSDRMIFMRKQKKDKEAHLKTMFDLGDVSEIL